MKASNRHTHACPDVTQRPSALGFRRVLYGLGSLRQGRALAALYQQ